MPGALEVDGLSVNYRAGHTLVHALDDVALTVPSGHRMAIVGESGSGKSTLGLAIMGLLPGNAAFTCQRLSIDGTAIDLRNQKQLRSLRGNSMSMVFQDAKASLDPVRTVGSQIAEPLRVHRIVPIRDIGHEVERLLRDVEIKRPTQAARQYPHELSGGMRQRAMIAAALAGRPSVLIADEPTSALDVTTQAAVIDLIGRLGQSDLMSTLLITHDLALVAGFADSVTVMYAGRIVETGPVDEIYSAPAHPYTRALLASIPSLVGNRSRLLGSIPGAVPDLSQRPAGCVFEPRCAVGRGREICQTVAPPMVTVPGGGQARCHFPGEQAAAPTDGADVAVAVTLGRANGTTPTVELRTIVKTFQRKSMTRGRRSRTVAVNGVDLVIGDGESVGIVGESGSGKTTLARVLVGLEVADSGEKMIRVGDALTAVSRLPKDYVQFVFQDPGDSLDPLMSVGDIIAEPLVLRDGGRANRYRNQVTALLDDVGLRADMAERRPMELSGGQRQRVAIARALSTQPKLIIADEAVASLDMSARGQILNLFSRLQAEHSFAYVYISHDLSMVRHVCDRVVVMYGGRVMESASTDDLFVGPRHPYTQALITAVPVPDPRVERQRERMAIRGEANDEAATTGCAFRTRCPIAQDLCAVEVPRLDPVSPHGVACHFADQAASLYERVSVGAETVLSAKGE